MATIAGEEPARHADRDLRVGHLHLHVGDVEEGLAFYRDLLGFEVMTHFGAAAFVAAGGYHHHLGFNAWRGEGVPPAPADAVGLERWTVLLDADCARRRCAADSTPPASQSRSATTASLVRDPWGIAALFAAPAAG